MKRVYKCRECSGYFKRNEVSKVKKIYEYIKSEIEYVCDDCYKESLQ